MWTLLGPLRRVGQCWQSPTHLLRSAMILVEFVHTEIHLKCCLWLRRQYWLGSDLDKQKRQSTAYTRACSLSCKGAKTRQSRAIASFLWKTLAPCSCSMHASTWFTHPSPRPQKLWKPSPCCWPEGGGKAKESKEGLLLSQLHWSSFPLGLTQAQLHLSGQNGIAWLHL